jgi:hypothetical protein
MALQGTLKDFGLADIFQLIGMQRKTGVLTVRHEQDVAKVSFLNGQVVYADTIKRRLDLRVGALLVKRGKMTSAQLEEALRIQSSTLQRLGAILLSKDMVALDDLREVLHVQVTQVIYDLFRWNDGVYEFSQEESVDYEESLFAPVSADTLLMEGARMVDEWPLIERRIRSFDLVFRRKAIPKEIPSGEEGKSFDLDADFDLAESASNELASGLLEEEARIYRLVDGRRTVREIVDLSPFVEFETCRILCDLLSRDLLSASTEEAPGRSAGRGIAGFSLVPVVRFMIPLAVAVSILTIPKNPFAPFVQGNFNPVNDILRPVSRSRLSRINLALRVFYLEEQTLPRNLDELVQKNHLAEEDLIDPWGRRYGYRLEPSRFVISGANASGEPEPELMVSKLLSPSQRLVIRGGPEDVKETISRRPNRSP